MIVYYYRLLYIIIYHYIHFILLYIIIYYYTLLYMIIYNNIFIYIIKYYYISLCTIIYYYVEGTVADQPAGRSVGKCHIWLPRRRGQYCIAKSPSFTPWNTHSGL